MSRLLIIVIHFLLLFAHFCSSIDQPFNGGHISGHLTLTANSNYVINDDIVIEKNGRLVIEEGVTLSFASRRGIIVYGTLHANASGKARITFTKRHASNARDNSIVVASDTNWPDVRLVDSGQPSEGRLQVKYKQHWHSVCTNSKNWTQTDITIACRQLGFESGTWFQWFVKNNDSRQLMFENPNCTGNEDRIQDCRNWNKRQIGSGICDYHMDIGIKCSKVLYPKLDYWSGIRFVNANYKEVFVEILKGKSRKKVSESVLDNVLITYAGENNNGEGVAALLTRGVPPQMKKVEVRWSAFNGIDIVYPSDAVFLEKVSAIENRGFGIFVNTSWGDVHLNGVVVENNGADGVYYSRHQNSEVGNDFCRFTNLDENQVYPVRLTHEQSRFSESSQQCCQAFRLPYNINPEAQLTVHFLEMLSEEFLGEEKDRRRTTEGFMEVFDGYSSKPVAKFYVRNDTYPQSITSVQKGLKICYTPAVLKRVLFTIVVVANIGRSFDLNVTRSSITHNNGRGIFVEGQRSGVIVNHTVVANHSYVAGIHFLYGSGDAIVNNSLIENNVGDGINISLSGGFKHIDRSIITRNSNRGIAIWFNESFEQLSFNFTSRVSYSVISENGGIGLLMGNVCRSDSFWNVSMNKFTENENDAVVFLSCWNTDERFLASLLISNNEFFGSKYLAIRMSPAFNIKQALIEHNMFRLHTRGVIYVNNYDAVSDDFAFENVETSVIIRDNYFAENTGLFVANIGLQEESKKQRLLFIKNILMNNSIREAYPKLNPRSRVAAVVAISSSNCVVIRNNLLNPESKFELGTHLDHHSKVINASYNFFGQISTKGRTTEIYERIFDRKNRYNLAQIEFLQYRTEEFDFDTYELLSQDKERDKFIPFQNGKDLGGEVRGVVELPSGVYNVKKDLFVRSGSKLVLNEGTTFNFDHSVGLMVQGHLEVRAHSMPITFTGSGLVSDSTYPVKPMQLPPLRNTTFLKNVTNSKKNTTVPLKPEVHKSNSTTGILRTARAIGFNVGTVRLSNGTDGRIEVKVDNQWGSVCSYGFDIVDAAVVCQQLGYVLNYNDWLLEKSQFAASSSLNNVILTNVQCTKFDTNILDCKAESRNRNDFEQSCPSEVGIRCYRPTWSGIRMGMVAEATELNNIVVENAGLLDFSTYRFKPGLQIDFNRHKIRDVKIQANSDTGIGIIFNDVFKNRDDITILDSQIVGNINHGLVLRSQGLKIVGCDFLSNRGSAIHYNPMTSSEEQRDLISWIIPDGAKNLIEIPSYFEKTSKSRTINLDPNAHPFWYLVIEKSPTQNSFQTFTLQTQTGYSIGIMVINPVIHPFTDKLDISVGTSSNVWNLRQNLTAFPRVNYAYKLSMKYSAGDNPRGNIILYITVKALEINPFLTFEERETEENLKLNTITVEGNLMRSNRRGFSSVHYNREISDYNDYYHRHNNETILLRRNKFFASLDEAILVNTPFYDPSKLSLTEINYTLIENHFENNHKVITQYSRDERNSNNLFHWAINDSTITQNLNGGIVIRLPYVWNFNENFTHTISINNNTVVGNHNFEFLIDGHFSRFNLTNNIFRDNLCKNGLIVVSGMEKEMRIEGNTINGNSGHYMVEFNLQSHADKFGSVEANFERNDIRRNKDLYDFKSTDKYRPLSYTIALRGVQYINITRNLMNNPQLQFEFIAGVLTGCLENDLNVGFNWWGTSNISHIQERIFDFDDWNSYAVANFSPFLATESFGSVPLVVELKQNSIDFTKSFGGRLYYSVTLKRRDVPYMIKSDLTIMPSVTLTLEAGVEMEFYPSVGLLVLGDLIAAGTADLPVIMKPAKRNETKQRFKRKDINSRNLKANDIGDVRLCYTETCKESSSNDGFLEIYNQTTLEWVPICDDRFTESNAEVVCQQLGYSRLNVHMKRGNRIDISPASVSRVRFWPESLQCEGHETHLKECDLRLNGYGNYSHGCQFDANNFVYIYCGTEKKSAEDEYWGGIRFAIAGFEHKSDGGFHIPTRSYFTPHSKLESVIVMNAGILHGEKNAAIQMIQRSIYLEFVQVVSSAHHGVEVIAPYNHLMFSGLDIKNNLGAGINYLLLNGAFTNTPIVPYVPLKSSTLPYNVFSLVDICDTNKNLVIEERVLLYFKYNNRPVDCVKIFTSAHQMKKIGFRMLQFNLFNATDYSEQPDSVLVYDGNIYNETGRVLLADYGVTDRHRREKNEEQFYDSTEASLSVRLHASGAGREYGFIAEVMTLPASYFNGRGIYNNVTYSEVSNNSLGAIVYKNAGETSPSISVTQSIFEDNCDELYGNFTSCEAAVTFDVQNAPNFYFRNNLLRKNDGAFRLEVNTKIAASAISGLLTNNLFVENKKSEAIYIKGPQTGSYQIIEVFRNFITRNISPFKDNVVLKQIVANFSQNVVVGNKGKHQIDVIGFVRVPFSYQTITRNWIYNNVAVRYDERSTIFASDAGQLYTMNYLVNPENDFELATMNMSEMGLRRPFIKAAYNWWGFDTRGAISGRILDYIDDPELISIKFEPYLTDNSSVLSGGCTGGWQKIGGTCFLYSGARMSFIEAKQFCELENSTMPYVRGTEGQLTNYLYNVQDEYNSRIHRVWVRSFNYDVDVCTVLYYDQITSHDCNDRLPFFCEKHLDINSGAYWYREPLGIAALTVSTVTALITLCCMMCWLCKSREKYKEKLQRRNSIRASIRSNRSFASSTSLTESVYRRQIEKAIASARQQQEQSSTVLQPVSSITFKSKDSFDSFEKSPSHFTGDEEYEPSPKPGDREYGEIEDRFAHDPKLENANIDLMVRPTFDLTYENAGFKDTPSASRTSEVDSTEARDWSPVNTLSTVDTKAHSASTYADFRPSRDNYDFAPTLSMRDYPKLSTFSRQPLPEDQDVFTFRSQSSLVGADSDTTGAAPSERKYLETSLDGDSFVDTNYDYYDFQSGRLSPTSTTVTASTNKSRPPLETAM